MSLQIQFDENDLRPLVQLAVAEALNVTKAVGAQA